MLKSDVAGLLRSSTPRFPSVIKTYPFPVFWLQDLVLVLSIRGYAESNKS